MLCSEAPFGLRISPESMSFRIFFSIHFLASLVILFSISKSNTPVFSIYLSSLYHFPPLPSPKMPQLAEQAPKGGRDTEGDGFPVKGSAKKRENQEREASKEEGGRQAPCLPPPQPLSRAPSNLVLDAEGRNDGGNFLPLFFWYIYGGSLGD